MIFCRSRAGRQLTVALAGALVLFGFRGHAFAQHEHHHEMQDAAEAMDHGMGHMSMAGPLDLDHTRWASGTSWQPDATPLSALHYMADDWMFMIHWNVLAGFDKQGSDRGGQQVMSVNWLMAMATHELAGGQIMARTMLSLEPITTTARGYPLLLQTGEEYDGVPLHDRQHPHDLFMEVAVSYLRPLTDDLALLVYLAPAGEPALGPSGFPHRLSAMLNPMAPIGHHWQDSTHISFGVVTAGIYTRALKLDGSWFNGREPDQNRYDFDLRRPDSLSARLTANPSDVLSGQISYGYLHSPEATEPDQSLHRLTASLTYDQPIRDSGNVAITIAVGRNITPGHGHGDSALGEASVELDAHHAVFGRAEVVQKTAHDLDVPPADDDTRFDVGKIDLGYVYRFTGIPYLVPGVGVSGSLGIVEPALRGVYGTRTPIGGMIFVSLQPPPLGH